MSLDYLTERASNFKLINLIQSYWRKRGYHVKAWIEKAHDPSNGATIYVVRTNIHQSLLTLDPAHTTI